MVQRNGRRIQLKGRTSNTRESSRDRMPFECNRKWKKKEKRNSRAGNDYGEKLLLVRLVRSFGRDAETLCGHTTRFSNQVAHTSTQWPYRSGADLQKKWQYRISILTFLTRKNTGVKTIKHVGRRSEDYNKSLCRSKSLLAGRSTKVTVIGHGCWYISRVQQTIGLFIIIIVLQT